MRTIVGSPAHLELSVGDSIPVRDFYELVEWTGLGRKRDTIPEFRRTSMVVSNFALALRDGYVVALRPGRSELITSLGTPDRLFHDDIRGIVPIIIH